MGFTGSFRPSHTDILPPFASSLHNQQTQQRLHENFLPANGEFADSRKSTVTKCSSDFPPNRNPGNDIRGNTTTYQRLGIKNPHTEMSSKASALETRALSQIQASPLDVNSSTEILTLKPHTVGENNNQQTESDYLMEELEISFLNENIISSKTNLTRVVATYPDQIGIRDSKGTNENMKLCNAIVTKTNNESFSNADLTNEPSPTVITDNRILRVEPGECNTSETLHSNTVKGGKLVDNVTVKSCLNNLWNNRQSDQLAPEKDYPHITLRKNVGQQPSPLPILDYEKHVTLRRSHCLSPHAPENESMFKEVVGLVESDQEL